MSLIQEKTYIVFKRVKDILVERNKVKPLENNTFLYGVAEKVLEVERILYKKEISNASIYIIKQEVYDFVSEIENFLNKNSFKDIVNDDEKLQQILEITYSIVYGYVQEYRLRSEIINDGLDKFCDFALWNFHNFLYCKDWINYSTYVLPYKLIKNNYDKLVEQTNEFSNQNLKMLVQKIDDWESSFDQKKNEVLELESRLEKSKQTYDFVLLNKGFKELYEQKKTELKERRNGYSFFGATLVCVPLVVIVGIVILILTGSESKLASMWFLTIPLTTLMLFLFYFTRVGLQHVRSVQSQMMQLELRMALCQFIHNYAEDSEKLHEKNKAGFEKFENIIFSPLVSSDDKIPTTFDGMEQLAKLVSEFRK